MSDFPILDEFHARMNEIPEWGRKMLGEMLTKQEEDRKTIIDLRAKITTTETALKKINDIRNSIVAFQTINWSEHIYPLVEALNDAGVEGMKYPEARKYWGTLLERCNQAEKKCDEAESQVKQLKDKITNDEILRNNLSYYRYKCGHIVGEKIADDCPICGFGEAQSKIDILRRALERIAPHTMEFDGEEIPTEEALIAVGALGRYERLINEQEAARSSD